MTLSEFIRIVDLTWTEVWHGGIWFMIINGVYTAILWSTAWTASRSTFIKNVLPKKMDGLIGRMEKEIKDLKFELAKERIEKEKYYDRLLVIKNSSEVRGIK